MVALQAYNLIKAINYIFKNIGGLIMTNNNYDLNNSILKIGDDVEFIYNDGTSIKLRDIIYTQDKNTNQLNKKVDKFEYRSWLTLAAVIVLAVPVGAIAVNRDALINYKDVIAAQNIKIRDQDSKIKDQDSKIKDQDILINELENRLIRLESK